MCVERGRERERERRVEGKKYEQVINLIKSVYQLMGLTVGQQVMEVKLMNSFLTCYYTFR